MRGSAVRLTTILDLVGLLLLVAGAAVAAWAYVDAWAGLVAAGAGVLGVSWLADRRVR